MSEADAAKPSYDIITHPTVEEMEQGLRAWAGQRPDILSVEVAGRSPEGLPVLLCRITDPSVPDEDKQVALITTCHGGHEINTVTGALRLIRWLLSDDPDAAEIRRRQIVLVMPSCDPEGLGLRRNGNSLGVSPYARWTPDGVSDPERSPEAVAIAEVIERYMPDAHTDLHGVWCDEQTMWESTGISWATALSRPYLPEFTREIDRRVEAQGFLMTRGEESAGQVLATAPVEGAEEHFYLQKSRINDCVYSYLRTHSLSFIIEAGFEESIVARVRAMLLLGHERWRHEPYPGYPCNQVGCWMSMAIAGWGTTAAERRRSRVELWRKLDQLSYGCAHPEPRGTMMAFCATNDRGAEYLQPKTIGEVLDGLEGVPGFDLPALRDFHRRTPARNAATMTDGGPGEPIEHGLAIRLLIPYRDAEITHLALNGHPLAQSPRDGYQVRRDPGTVVQVNIPPGEVRDLHIVTCAYDEDTRRRSGFRPEDWSLR